MTVLTTEKAFTGSATSGQRRISSDLVIGLMSIVIVTAGLGISLNYLIVDRKAGQALEKEADQYLSYLTESLELPVWSMDDETVRKIADAYMVSNLFSLLEITSNESEQKYIYSKKNPGEDEMVLRRGPLIHGGQDIGSIRLGLSKMPYKNELSRQLRSILWLAAIIVLAIVATISILLRILVYGPLRLLMEVAEDMARGNYDRRENKIKHYEIAMVHDQLITMGESVKGREASLENANIQLRNQVKLRMESEQELHRLQNYLYNIINSMPSILVAVDRDGNVTQWNNQTQEATGLSSEEAHGRPLVKVFPRLAGEMERIKTSIMERRVINSLKNTRKVENENRFEDITIFPLVANGVEGAVIRVDDVTEQVRLEEMMIQSEKMLTVGGLAAGMAHEINNPLAGMMQTADVMAGRLKYNLYVPAGRKAAEAAGTTLEAIEQFMAAREIPRMLDTIITSGRRVAAIVNNMLSFARKSDASVSSHSLSDLLDKTAVLAATDYDLKKQYDFKRIDIIREYAQNLPDVPCESGKIQQVLLNVLRNGAQAMQAAATELPRFIFRTRFESGRNMAIIEIEDNGPGMDEQTRKRIFEPFFTTKAVGEGTGLGLSVSYFIITENHRGEMAVVSRPGAGATFIIRLPV